MLNLLRKNSTASLQKKYDNLMKEAYLLSKENPEESRKKQAEAREIQKQLVARRAA